MAAIFKKTAPEFSCPGLFTKKAKQKLFALCLRLLSRHVFQNQPLQSQHGDEKDNSAAKAEQSEQTEDRVSGNKSQNAQPHPEIEFKLLLHQGGNGIGAAGIKHDCQQIEGKQNHISEDGKRNDNPVQKRLEDFRIVALRQIKRTRDRER